MDISNDQAHHMLSHAQGSSLADVIAHSLSLSISSSVDDQQAGAFSSEALPLHSLARPWCSSVLVLHALLHP